MRARALALRAADARSVAAARPTGSPTQALHRVSFDLHAELAERLGVTSYRRISTLSVRTRPNGARDAMPPPAAWLDGEELSSATLMDANTAQVTPLELTHALMDAALAGGATLRRGVVTGLDTEERSGGERAITAVRVDGQPLRCRRAVVAMGPWSVLAEDWLGVCVPLEGIKSASVVYRGEALRAAVLAEPFALFCGEDPRYGTHLETYPRSNGDTYICGIGGSDYVSGARLRPGGDTESQERVAPDPARVTAARAAFAGISKLAGGGEPDVTQACMRPCAPDALPIMGAVPGVAGAFIAAGHNCWGILWAPVSGLAMAELLVDGKASCVDLSAFSPARFAQRSKGGRGRKQGAEAVGEQW
jgi:glycine/D-amino acid oxidase-like deaminating enzyme